MKKPITLILTVFMAITSSLDGCNNKEDNNDTLLTLCELPESQEEIGNQIPQWVCYADWALPLNVMTSTDLDKRCTILMIQCQKLEWFIIQSF